LNPCLDTHRVAISNERILLHVLPKGFKRIRHYGILGPAGKAVKLAQARAALLVPTPVRVPFSRGPP
jgi:hypothetical protein